MRGGRGTRERSRPSAWQRFKEALHSNQNFEYLYWLQVIIGFVFDWTLRLIGPILLVLATGLISGIICVYFAFILPATATFASITSSALMYVPITVLIVMITVYSRQYMLHASWAIFLAFNVFFNYYHCAFTHPGKPSDFLPTSGRGDSEEEETTDDEETGTRHLLGDSAAISRVKVGGNSEGSGEGGRSINRGAGMSVVARGAGGSAIASSTPSGIRLRAGFCKKCRQAKPARTHHCHVCNQCIVNMDHHCPWMNNCVGYLNYRYFVLFLMYMFVGCVYGVLITAPKFLSISKVTHPRIRGAAHGMDEKSAVMMTFVLCFSVGIAISVLLGWHIYLILTAQTTIDFYQNQTNRARARQWGELWSNPFDVGYKGNWQQVFGPSPFLLGLLPSRRAPPPPVVEFFPLELRERDLRRELRRPLADEGEWTVDSPADGEHIV